MGLEEAVVLACTARRDFTMIIQVVKFKSGLSTEEARRIMDERAPDYRALPGLLHKYYVQEPATGDLGGIYLWDSEKSLPAFRESDLASTISVASSFSASERLSKFIEPIVAHSPSTTNVFECSTVGCHS